MAALVFASCQQEEIVQSPEFTVTDGAGNVVLAYGQSNQYTLPIAFNAYSLSASASTETLASETFTVNSNCSWRIVPAEEGQDWIRPYPDNGNERGKFIFINERNYDQKNDRSAYFNIIINDGENDIPVDGMIIVNQSEATDFLKVSTAAVDVLKEGAKNQRISILSNQKWEYKLTPDSDYATENLDWIEDKTVHPADQSIDTLVFTYQPNENGTIRGAILDITVKDRPEFNKQIKIVQYGADVEIEGFPVKWAVRVADNTYAGTFPSSGIMPPVSGAGQIRFDNTCSKAADVNGKTLFDVSDNCPRVTGVWPGDYCEFKASSPVSAGSLIKLVFATRVSGTGHKYWRLEYRDGQTWKLAGPAMTAADANGPDGQPAVYTHEMAADGSTNILVSSVVKYENTTDEVVFRFICAANYQANGKGALAAPNGGTWRLAVNSKEASDEYQPCISCVAAGSEVLTPANIEVSGVTDNIITFEGTPAEPFKFNVTSDMDFQVTSDASWLTVENGTGAAYESNEVVVTCAPSNVSTLRKATIEIKSGISKYILHVIQSAAGGELEPFVSIVEGNTLETAYNEKTFIYSVQSNVEYEVVSDVDWITIHPATRALVEVNTFSFTVAKNSTYESRTGHVIVSDTSHKYMSVLLVTQEGITPLHAEWLFNAEAMADASTGYAATFNDATRAAGDGGQYVMANVKGNGKITYVQADKTGLTVVNNSSGNPFEPSRTVGSTGHPFATGAWTGDYWLFEATDGEEYPAGTKLNISFITRISGTGQKYWMLEYWDGEAWIPASDLQTATVGTETISYNFSPTTKTSNSAVDVTWTLAKPCTVMKFKYSCVANCPADGKEYAGVNGGTVRIAGAVGTSPVFKVVTE